MTRTLLPYLIFVLVLVACGGDDAQATAEPATEPPLAEEEPPPDDVIVGGEEEAAMAAAAARAAEGLGAALAAGQVAPGAALAAVGEAGAGANPALLDPAQANATAPEKYTVKFETTAGDILIDVTRSWAPRGADRFYNLVAIGYYDDVAFFRVIEGFMAQIGIHGEPAVNRVWRNARIEDDPVTQSNTTGMVTFATAGPNTRTTQIFLNLDDNANLDGMGFAPFGKLRDTVTLKKLHAGYGEGAPQGTGPHQGKLQSEGNAYLKTSFPKLDYVKKATIVTE